MPTWPTRFFRNNGGRRSSSVSMPVGKPAYTLIYSTGIWPWKISWEYLKRGTRHSRYVGNRNTNHMLLPTGESQMNWKTAYRSFYYENAEEPVDIVLYPSETALLIIDIQNTYLQPSDDPQETARWKPFYDRMNKQVIPTTAKIIDDARSRDVEVIYVRIACQKDDGRDRSLSQKKPGFNYLLLPKNGYDSQIIPELQPLKKKCL